jgi:hypothetical protein
VVSFTPRPLYPQGKSPWHPLDKRLDGRMRWAGHVARMGEGSRVYRILVRRSEGKRPVGRPRRRWEDSIKLDLREIGIYGAN